MQTSFNFFKLLAHERDRNVNLLHKEQNENSRNKNYRMARPCEPCNLFQSKSGIRMKIKSYNSVNYRYITMSVTAQEGRR
jgi:hypothetical protein